jgi:hypothetical protein
MPKRQEQVTIAANDAVEEPTVDGR